MGGEAHAPELVEAAVVDRRLGVIVVLATHCEEFEIWIGKV